MALVSNCNVCNKIKLIVPGEFVCYDCFPKMYEERLTNFINTLNLSEERKKEFNYLLEHFKLTQTQKEIRY